MKQKTIYIMMGTRNERKERNNAENKKKFRSFRSFRVPICIMETNYHLVLG